MKRAGSMLVLCAMLILSLTACGSKPANTKRAIMNEGKQMMLDAKYYAAPNGRVRGMGKDVYLVYCAFMAAGRGVDFFGCDNHLIKKLTSFCYINDIRVGGKNGYIVGMLHNGNMIARHGLPGVNYETTAGYESENHVARVYNATIIVDGAQNETIYNSFAYGVRHLIHQIDSKNTLAVNVGADNIGDNSPQLLLEGGSFVGVNILRYNGISCEYTSGTSVRLYARLGINERREETLIVK